MIILGLDTSTSIISVSITKEHQVLASLAVARGRSSASHILHAMDTLLGQAGMKIHACDALACAVGPGSFTGLRVGIATVQGLAEGCGLPVVGVPTLEAYAHALPGVEGLLCPMVDARKQEVYVAGYRWEDEKLVEVWPPVAIAPEGLASLARGETVLLLGEGARVYHHRLAEALGRKARFGPVDLDVSNASRIARLGACRIEKGLGGDPAGLKPVYGRPSEAELASGRRRRN